MNEPDESVIFVFGSNLAGRHGAGAALDAKKYWGAIDGLGLGRQGQSYAIPTKNVVLATRPLKPNIYYDVQLFIDYAEDRPDLDFQVTRIGCGLAGYKDEDIAPMFKGAPPNVHLPLGWRELAK